MSRVITQNTFDNAVKENIEEFSMSTEEAVRDAIKQFESQGVNLRNIITSSLLSNEVSNMTRKVEELKQLFEGDDTDDSKLIDMLNDVKDECDVIAKRILAAQCGLYSCLITFLTSHPNVKDPLKVAIFECLIALMTGYPDLLDSSGFNIIGKSLKDPQSESLLLLTLKWSVECCLRHEENREKFLTSEDIINSLKEMLDKESFSPDALRMLCKLFQTFVLNDDIRAEFPRGHQRACQISNEFLNPLITLLRSYKTDKKILLAVIQALIAIIVRNEYCQHFLDAGGLELLRDILLDYTEDEILCRSCFSLIKVVAGNDTVKAKTMEIIDPTVLISVVQKYLSSEKTCARGLAAFSMLTLRNNNNCKLLSDNNVAELIVQAMKIHATMKKLLKNVCWLIKNLVQANEKIAADFLKLGAEECLRDMLKDHKDCAFEANVGLRLLGFSVECEEPWTGEGKGITN